MKKTLDFNKMKKAHTAKKKWELLQLEKQLEESVLNSSHASAQPQDKNQQRVRKSS